MFSNLSINDLTLTIILFSCYIPNYQPYNWFEFYQSWDLKSMSTVIGIHIKKP